MKNTSTRYSILTWAAFLTAILFCLCSCGKKKKSAPETIPTVHVAEAYTDSVVLYKTFPGTIRAGITTDVVARVSGTILSKHFTGGSYVYKGQPLFTIESTSYRDAVERAEASLATARSQYDYYSRQTAAMKKALEADAVSKMQVVQAESNMREAQASIKEAEAALSTARQNLAYCTVTAPASGYITAPTLDVGNYVGGGAAAVTLATIYDNSQLEAVFSLSDTQYEELLGTTGGLRSSLYRNVPLKFREPMKNSYTTNLYYEAPSVDESTGSLMLKGKLSNVNNELKNGMYVTVSLPYGTDAHAILVKDAALGSDQLGYYLYTVNDSDIVRHTPVKVGDLYQDSLRIITSGIRPGERYVTKALLTVRSGERVRPVLSK